MHKTRLISGTLFPFRITFDGWYWHAVARILLPLTKRRGAAPVAAWSFRRALRPFGGRHHCCRERHHRFGGRWATSPLRKAELSIRKAALSLWRACMIAAESDIIAAELRHRPFEGRHHCCGGWHHRFGGRHTYLQWRSQDFPPGGGVRTRLRAHCARKGPTKLRPIFSNAGLRQKKNMNRFNLIFRKIESSHSSNFFFWIKWFDSMHDSISFSNNWIDSANDSSGPKINYSNWFITQSKI